MHKILSVKPLCMVVSYRFTVSIFFKPYLNGRPKFLLYKQYTHSFITSATNQFISKRLLSTRPTLHPWWLTGFIDGEGCFTINLVKNSALTTGWRVKLCFSLGLHKKDKELLELIKINLGGGKIYKQSSLQSFQLQVESIKEIAKIIQHLSKFTLITKKRADYELWKKAFDLIQKGEHLTVDGLNQIAGLKEKLNRCRLSPMLESAFPNRTPVERPLVKNQKIQDPNWLAGFTSGEGCFLIDILKNDNSRLGSHIQLNFKLTQHYRDELLMRSLIEYFNCGKVYLRADAFDFRVTKFADIENKIIPFFNKYPILGVKSKDFEDWSKVTDMMKENKHLTIEGLEQIKKIKAGMNKGRK